MCKPIVFSESLFKRVVVLVSILIISVSCESKFAETIHQTTATAEHPPITSIPNQNTVSSQKLQATKILLQKEIKPIQLFWFPNAPTDHSTYQILAKHFNFFIFTQDEEAARNEIEALGGNGTFLQYVLFNAIKDEDKSTCFEIPYQARADNQPGDFCMIRDQHPDWLLRSNDGNPILTDFGGVLMDPANKGWREFWLERIKINQDQNGWDGVLLDNVEAGASYVSRFSSNKLPESFSEAKYTKAIEEFLKYLYGNYFHPERRQLYANIIGLHDQDVVLNYLNYLDGILLENFAVGWEDNYLDQGTWEEQLLLAEQTQHRGKKILLASQGKQYDLKHQEFALASYLLINQGDAFFRYTYAGKSTINPDLPAYGELWMYKNYLLNLGQPLGQAYRQGNLWRRDFEFGHVIVDPISHLTEFTGKHSDSK